MTTSAEIDAKVAGETVASRFVKSVEEYADRIAQRTKGPDDNWVEFTYREWGDLAARAAAGLKARGVTPGSRVVLMLRNRPEFAVLDMAVVLCGATPISIYNSSSAEQIAYLAGHCEAVLGIVEADWYGRFAEARADLPKLTEVGVVGGDAPDGAFTYDDLLASDPVDLAEAAEASTPDGLATVIYTSGTTGPPKGVMITHYNVAWTVESLLQAMPPGFDLKGAKAVVSYLPMAHIAERCVSYYGAVWHGLEVTNCPEPTGLALYAREVRPHMVFGVPRVWEKIYAGVNAALGADPEKKAGFEAMLPTAIELSEALDWDRATDEQKDQWKFLDDVALKNVRALIGMDRCEVAITGAAPIPADMLRWFRALGIPLSEVYGMSESTGPMTWTGHRVKPGTVGPEIPGCEVRLAEDGEVICKGGNVFAGYLNDPEKTADTVDADGWLHSGDIGVMDDDGYVKIVDRKKELIITAGGKNISPANLEAALKMIPIVGQACAIGDNKPFVSALVVLDPDMAPAWAAQQGIAFENLTDLATKAEVIAEVERALEDVMAGFNNAERVKKVTVIGDEWLPDSDILTPTSKLKRRAIHEHYADVISALYD